MGFFTRNKKYKIHDYDHNVIGTIKARQVASVHVVHKHDPERDRMSAVLYIMKFDGTMDVYKYINPFEALIIEYHLNHARGL